MFDIRYHVVSLVAVFLALALGILLGTVIVDKGILVEQQKALVERLEADFARIREDNRNLNRKVQSDAEFARQMLSLLAKDKLRDRNVIVLVTREGASSEESRVLDTLSVAGASTSAIVIKTPWKLSDEAKARLNPYLVGTSPGPVEPRILERLVRELVSPADRRFLTELSNSGLVSIDAAPSARITEAVVLGGGDEEDSSAEIDLPLIERLKAAGVRVVGVETSDSKISYMRSYQGAGVGTVDNIDQEPGLISMVLSLDGAAGNFGVKPTAGGLLPAQIP